MAAGWEEGGTQRSTRGDSTTNLAPKHAQDLAAFVAHDCLVDLVPEDRYGDTEIVVRIGSVVDLAQVSVVLVTRHRVWHHVLARDIGIFGGAETPS